MSNIWLLLKPQLFGVFDFFSGKKSKKKSNVFLLLLGFCFTVALLAASFVYNFMLAEGLMEFGQMQALLAIMVFFSSFLVLMTTVYKVNGVLFGFHDYDMLMALPVKTSQIIISRLLLLYCMNVYFCFIVMLPAVVVYGMKMAPGFLFYGYAFIGTLFLPLLPIVLAAAIGMIAAWISSHFRYKQILNLLLTFVFIIAIIVGSFFLGSMNNQTIGLLADDIGQMIGRFYPPVHLFLQATVAGNGLALVTFLAVSLFVFFLFAFLYSKKFKAINSAFQTSYSRSNFKMGSLQTSSPLRALYKKELKHYFHSSIYVFNTAVGSVMLFIGAVALLFLKNGQLAMILQFPEIKYYVDIFVPMIVSIMVGLTCTTGCSISLEGKNMWILQSAPIGVGTIFKSKLLLNLTITLPVILISGIFIRIALPMSTLGTLFLFLLPTVYAFFVSYMGLVVNLKLPKMDWKSETVVIKQSASAFAVAMIGLFAGGLPIVPLLFWHGINGFVYLGALTAIVLLVTVALALFLQKKGAAIFRSL